MIIAVGIFLGLVVHVLEFLAGMVIPIAGGSVLAWFAYRLFVQPVLRRRKLDRIRDDRARRAESRLDGDEQI